MARIKLAAAMVVSVLQSAPLPAAAQLVGNSVSTDPCSSGIGGNVTNSRINVVCGIPYEKFEEAVSERTHPLEELNESQKETLSLLRSNLELNQSQMLTALGIVGETNIPPEELGAKLIEIAQRLKDLENAAPPMPGDTAEVAALKVEVQKAIDAGDLDKADSLLVNIQEKEKQALDRMAVNAAETTARRGDIALTRLRYAEAAKQFADAAAAIPPGNDDTRIGYLQREANALFRQGDEFGDNAALSLAIERYKGLLELLPRDRTPLDWARTQNKLGNALEVLGERETGTARLEEAATADHLALAELTSDRTPADWAKAQNDLGNALETLGERATGTVRLDEAVTAYRAALGVWTIDRSPLDWATANDNLADALTALGERETDTAQLKEAVADYKMVLGVWTRGHVPLDWAMAQSNLGDALVMLGQRESGTDLLEEAVVADKAALEEWTRQRVPLDWATAEGNLGDALTALGKRETGTERLDEAVTAYLAALNEFTRDRVPLDWAATQVSLGIALETLGEREPGTTQLDEAATAYRAALDEFALERAPQEDQATAQDGLRSTLAMLEKRKTSAQ